MGNRYVVMRDNVTPASPNELLTLVSASNRRCKVTSMEVVGLGTSSAAQRLIAANSATGTTGGGAITPDKADNVDQPAAATVVDTTWSAQPTLNTNGIILGWNALGGPNRWVTQPGRPDGMLEARNGAYISIRAAAGVTYQACSFSLTFEE